MLLIGLDRNMQVNDFLNTIGAKVLPRILTQICRDPSSPFWGCCDRNWWHYKIRDFPSSILQQAGYTISLAADVNFGHLDNDELKNLAAGTCRFWNERALRHGAFEEYYPYEQGYPPVAFSTLAVAKLCTDGVVKLSEIQSGLEIAAKQLLSRFEAEAANQQVAGTAALAVIRKLVPDLIPETAFQHIFDRTLKLQTQEGWFPEYDGPDLGYLSVTMDCLWDLFDATGNDRCRKAIIAAFDYISWFVLGPFGGAGMHNARNTDYIVPYGLARLACESSSNGRAQEVMAELYGKENTSSHFFDAVDDRYWCHYIGHSVYRALKVMATQGKVGPESVYGTKTALARSMPESGHVLLHNASTQSPNVLVSTRKGAIFTAVWPNGQKVVDFGWIIYSRKKWYVSHWWSLDWKTLNRDGVVGCDGVFVAHKEHVSLPWKHMLLRLMSYFCGLRMIGLLKQLMIFKKSGVSHAFSRRVSCEGATIIVEDSITGLKSDDKLTRAPRSSKRHVASADSFHPEDFERAKDIVFSKHIDEESGVTTIITKYNPG